LWTAKFCPSKAILILRNIYLVDLHDKIEILHTRTCQTILLLGPKGTLFGSLDNLFPNRLHVTHEGILKTAPAELHLTQDIIQVIVY
jgi:hypothetical protein